MILTLELKNVKFFVISWIRQYKLNNTNTIVLVTVSPCARHILLFAAIEPARDLNHILMREYSSFFKQKRFAVQVQFFLQTEDRVAGCVRASSVCNCQGKC